MSEQMRPVPTRVIVCDLCREPIGTIAAAERSSLVAGYLSAPGTERTRAWYLLWDPRNWTGVKRPSFDQQRADPERWERRLYDFHTECLLALVEREIAALTGPAR